MKLLCSIASKTSVVFALVGFCSPAVEGIQPRTTRSVDAYSQTHSLVTSMYPGLSGRNLVFTISAARWQPLDGRVSPLSSVVVRVGEKHSETEIDTLFRAHVSFSEDRTLYDFIADTESPFMQHERLRTLGRLIVDHRDWSDAEIVRAINAAGVRFGPDDRDAVERELKARTEAIGRVLGSATFGDLYFSARDDEPRWTFEIAIATPKGRKAYRAGMDPFDGKLLGMSKAGV